MYNSSVKSNIKRDTKPQKALKRKTKQNFIVVFFCCTFNYKPHYSVINTNVII